MSKNIYCFTQKPSWSVRDKCDYGNSVMLYSGETHIIKDPENLGRFTSLVIKAVFIEELYFEKNNIVFHFFGDSKLLPRLRVGIPRNGWGRGNHHRS